MTHFQATVPHYWLRRFIGHKIWFRPDGVADCDWRDNQERCLGEDEMLWIDPILRYWQYEEDRRGRQHRAYAKTGTPILIL